MSENYINSVCDVLEAKRFLLRSQQVPDFDACYFCDAKSDSVRISNVPLFEGNDRVVASACRSCLSDLDTMIRNATCGRCGRVVPAKEKVYLCSDCAYDLHSEGIDIWI